MIFAFDFDGTIVEHIFPEIGPLRKNAVEVINRLYDEGHTIIIWTVRSHTDNKVDEMKAYLDKIGLKYHKINEDADEVANHPDFTDFSPKVYADVYVDDRDYKGIDDDWEDIYTQIQKHPKYKNNAKGS